MASMDCLVKPKPPPELHIPESTSIVNTFIIDTTSYMTIPVQYLIKPSVGGLKVLECPSYSFLITHPPSGRKLLFDLGIRFDWENGPKVLVDQIKGSQNLAGGSGRSSVRVEKNTIDILREHNVDPTEVEAIIWSHYHFDHCGDPRTFPSSTALIVGPGFTGRFPNAWPTIADAVVDEKAWSGRELREISFNNSTLKIGRFRAIDYFEDGSFYLLDSPGHLLGHMCGLARTTQDTFILMGGDVIHHAGEIRPTEYLPLPSNVRIHSPPPKFPVPCPGEIFQKHIHPEQSATKPFFTAAKGFNEIEEVADHSTEGAAELDAHDNIFSIIAHDRSLLEIVDFFPKSANDWSKKGWKAKGTWEFLRDFAPGVEELKDAGKL